MRLALNNFYLLDKLIDVNSIFFYPGTVCLHYLLTNVSLIHWAALTFVFTNIVSSRHLLHLNNRFLTINLTNERLHTLCHTLTYLSRHIRNDIDDFLLPLLSLIISFDHIENIVIFVNRSRNLRFDIELFPLISWQTLNHIIL